jgi:hypothetical protein
MAISFDELDTQMRVAAFEHVRRLPFLDTYRTMCRAPEPAFRQILEDVRELGFAA